MLITPPVSYSQDSSWGYYVGEWKKDATQTTYPNGSAFPPDPVYECLNRSSELVTGVTVYRAIGERKDPARFDREDEGHTIFGPKGSIAHLEVPSPVPLSGPRLGKALEYIIVSDLGSFTLD